MKKLSLANIQGKLSRLEMKNIMAGSGSPTGQTKCCSSDGSYCTACERQSDDKSCCCGYTMANC